MDAGGAEDVNRGAVQVLLKPHFFISDILGSLRGLFMSKKRVSKIFWLDDELSKKYSYSSKRQIKTIVRHYFQLRSLSEKGVVMATCIKADIDKALSFSGYKDNFCYKDFTTEQYLIVYYHLMLGMTQHDVAHMLGVTQGLVSQQTKIILSKLLSLLYQGGNGYDYRKSEDEPGQSGKHYRGLVDKKIKGSGPM